MGSKAVSGYILVQPWFSAHGHPAQSLLNLARIVPANRLSFFLVSRFDHDGPFGDAGAKLAGIAPVLTFTPFGTNLRWNTCLAAVKLFLLSWKPWARGHKPIFVDCDLFALTLLGSLGMFVLLACPAAVILHGPDRFRRHTFLAAAVKWVLTVKQYTIFLRSAQHLAAWRDFCPRGRFRMLPPVEAVEPCVKVPTPPRSDTSGTPLAIGVIGQIRPGKNIRALLALADRNPQVLQVNVRGPLSECEMPEIKAAIAGRADVKIGYMSEEEMMQTACGQDYLACLFESIWDLNSESATFWLAVKVLRPVVSFDEGWVADMVRATGGGIVIGSGDLPLLATKLPGPGTPAYRDLQNALQRFRASLEPTAMWTNLEVMML